MATTSVSSAFSNSNNLVKNENIISHSLLPQLAALAVAGPLVYEGTEGLGKGKHIVFIASDHEYRGEETCPAIARILAKRYGFKCTVPLGSMKTATSRRVFRMSPASRCLRMRT